MQQVVEKVEKESSTHQKKKTVTEAVSWTDSENEDESEPVSDPKSEKTTLVEAKTGTKSSHSGWTSDEVESPKKFQKVTSMVPKLVATPEKSLISKIENDTTNKADDSLKTTPVKNFNENPRSQNSITTIFSCKDIRHSEIKEPEVSIKAEKSPGTQIDTSSQADTNVLMADNLNLLNDSISTIKSNKLDSIMSTENEVMCSENLNNDVFVEDLKIGADQPTISKVQTEPLHEVVDTDPELIALEKSEVKVLPAKDGRKLICGFIIAERIEMVRKDKSPTSNNRSYVPVTMIALSPPKFAGLLIEADARKSNVSRNKKFNFAAVFMDKLQARGKPSYLEGHRIRMIKHNQKCFIKNYDALFKGVIRNYVITIG